MYTVNIRLKEEKCGVSALTNIMLEEICVICREDIF